MKISKLKLRNFRKFEDYVFSFHPKFTVIIGDNASGKSSILDALSIMLGTYLLRSGVSTGRSGIKKDEARLIVTEKDEQVFLEPQKDVFIQAIGSLRDEKIDWKRNIGDKGKNAKNLIQKGVDDLNKVSKGKDIEIPVLLYYGTGRLWNKHSRIQLGKPDSRTAGYRNCLDLKSEHELFERWFKRLELASLQKKKEIGALEAVREAVKNCVPGSKNFYFDISSDCLMIEMEKEGLCPFNNLSDGYRNMVAIVADIAHRASRLNPHFGKDAAKEASGVVLIDEIDLHLHPKWQRQVVGDLKKTFPKLQFIVTTHSPFIIQSLASGEMIDLNHLEQDIDSYGFPDGIALPAPKCEFSNKTIEDIAEGVMGVEVPQRSKRYQDMDRVAKEYYKILQDAKGSDEGKKEELKRKLDELSAPFSDNVGYHAFLEMKRVAAGLGNSGEQE